jgi:hypothetical protein
MIYRTLLFVFLTACSYDLGALEGAKDGGLNVPDSDAAQLSSAATTSARFDGGVVRTIDAMSLTDAVVVLPTDATPPSPDTMSPPVDIVPESVVPRRNGVTCRRDDQCGHPTFVDGKMKCIAAVCTACVGSACGICEIGPAKGFACPVRGSTSSACGACAGDGRLWCTSMHPCADGSACLLSSCL